MTSTINNLLRPAFAIRLLLAVAAASLIFVYSAEYGFGLQPCYLCLWQRGPYFAVLLFGFLALARPDDGPWVRGMLVLCALAFASNVGLAIYHSGVERHLWAGTEACALQPAAQSAADLLQTPVARCDQISWTFLGLSMTNWNALLSMDLLTYTMLVLLWRRKPQNA